MRDTGGLRLPAESSARYRGLVVRVPAVICELAVDGTTLFVNDAVASLTGYEPEELQGKNWWNVLCPQCQPRKTIDLLQSLEPGETVSREVVVTRKDGSTRTLLLTSQYGHTRDGAPRAQGPDSPEEATLVCLFADAYAPGRSEPALREGEELYRSIVETAVEGIWILDANLRTTFVNQKMADMLGYTVEEMMALPVLEFIHEQDRAETAKRLERHLQGMDQQGMDQQLDYNFRRKDGSDLWSIVSVSPIRDKEGQFASILGMFTDITERKQTEALFKVLFDNSPIGIFIVQEGKFKFVNLQFIKYLGYCEEELLGRNPLELVLSEDRSAVRESATRMLTGDRVAPYEYRVVNKAGEVRWIMETISSIQYKGKRAALGNFIDVTARKQAEQQLAYLATHDPLTGQPNRRSLEDSLKRVVARARRGVPSTLLMLDVDNFKLVNDTLGHSAGDRALVTLAGMLYDQLRAEDLLSRLGGDEFAVLLEGIGVEDARGIAERMRRSIAESPLCLDGLTFNLSLSVGLVAIDGHQTSVVVLSQADSAMYRAKQQGGNRVVPYRQEEDDIAWLSDANRLVIRIKQALRQGLFVLHYQPVVRLSDGHVEYYEALVRLCGEKGETIHPAEFIPAAERFGLMPQLTRWIVQQAVNKLREHPDMRLSVNLSTLDLSDDALPEFIEEQLRENGVEPERLVFEINEKSVIGDLPRAERWIRRLKLVGCRLALDDLGAGFASFVYLRHLPVDQLKMNGDFIRALETDPAQGILVQAIHTLAASQGKETVGAFVESATIAHALKGIGVTHGQGYFFGAPAPELPVANGQGP